jgi:hypothetical protein
MINDQFLTNPFARSEIPPFPCPACGSSLVEDNSNSYREASSTDARKFIQLTGEVEAECGTFALWLKCSRQPCRETVCCVGSYNMTIVNRHDSEHLESFLTPLFFHPIVPIFPYSDTLPDRIVNPLKESFSLFWSNPAASGNSLRITLERIMDHFGIKRFSRGAKGERGRMNLHHRIEHFGKRPGNTEVAAKLLALKWLGNHGSHTSGLQPQDLVKAFRLLEYVIEELFQKRTHTLTKLAAQINRRKGP